MPRPLVDLFDLLSPIYERVIHSPDIEQLEALLDLQAGQRLLDVGGGTGRVTRLLTEKGVRLFIADPSAGMLHQAQEKGCCRVLLAPSERLPFAAGSFERVIAVDAFHHFWRHEAAAQEMVRVLAPGGRIVVEEPDVRHLGVKLVALAERIALMRSRFHPPAELARLFQRAGGRVTLHEKGINFWVVIET
jgi:demethylmenaquinone methyltransferase/2-methoxy-6-polyprenyl-1,4-benzoquinol methylase